MDDEFALCWNNFQENIASGFQNLFDRGDLVDVTLACDGKLLQAHKIVLAICSPYFQEMFITNPCRHPIIVLKDVSYTVMTELLQFMYQGVVNVKHTELNSFMKIAQQLQIKGLATSSSTSNQQMNHPHSQKPTPPSPKNPIESYANTFNHSTPSIGQKRSALDYVGIYGGDAGNSAKKQIKRSTGSVDNDISTESMENMSSEDGFPIPQISMTESGCFDLSSVKRENNEQLSSPGSSRHLPSAFNFDYNRASNSSNMSGNSSNPINANHMDIPTGGSIAMLSSTSLLHGNCVFNRNNTVATQQGMKTYWLCKSYRITMCRARCITYQGRVISSTGMHNHSSHMKGSHTTNDLNGNTMAATMRLASHMPPAISFSQCHSSSNTHTNHNIVAMSKHQRNVHESNDSHSHSHDVHSNEQNVHHSPVTNQHQHHNETIFHPNMMHTVLHPNNLMHLPGMVAALGPVQNHAQLPHLNSHNMQQSTAELHTTGAHATDNRQNLDSSPISPISSVQQQNIPSDLNRLSQPHQHSAMHPGNQYQNHSQQIKHMNSPSVESSSYSNTNQLTIDNNDFTVHHPMANELPHSPSFKLEEI